MTYVTNQAIDDNTEVPKFTSAFNNYINKKSNETYQKFCHDCKFNKGRIDNNIICGNDGAKALLTFDSCIGKKKN